MRIGIALLLACSAFWSAGVSPQEVTPTKNQSPPFMLTIQAVPNPVKAGSELVLEISAKNVSDHDVNNSGYFTAAANYVFYITREGGNTVPEKESLKAIRSGRRMDSLVFGTLKTGEAATESVILSDYYDFGRPGNYKIQVLREREPGGKGVKSNTITVTVVP